MQKVFLGGNCILSKNKTCSYYNVKQSKKSFYLHQNLHVDSYGNWIHNCQNLGAAKIPLTI